MRGLCTCAAGRTVLFKFIYAGVSPSSSAVAALRLFAKASVAAAGGDVCPLLSTFQSCTDEGEEAPEFLGLC